MSSDDQPSGVLLIPGDVDVEELTARLRARYGAPVKVTSRWPQTKKRRTVWAGYLALAGYVGWVAHVFAELMLPDPLYVVARIVVIAAAAGFMVWAWRPEPVDEERLPAWGPNGGLWIVPPAKAVEDV